MFPTRKRTQRAVMVMAFAAFTMVGCKRKPSGACFSDGCPTDGGHGVANCYDVEREEDCQSAEHLACPYTFEADVDCESLGYYPACQEDGDGIPAEDGDDSPLFLCGVGGAGGAGGDTSAAGSAGESGN